MFLAIVLSYNFALAMQKRQWSSATLKCPPDAAIFCQRPLERPPHILNTPNLVSPTGALSAAENASASTRRVSDGAMMPSSHSRAVA